MWWRECSPLSSSARISASRPERSAITEWRWIVSRFSWRARTKPPLAELRVGLGDSADHLADAVLDEAGIAVGLLDHGDLVGALHQLVDLRAHRLLDDVQEVAGVDVELDALRAADVKRADAALVVGRDGDGREDALDLVVGEAVGGEALAGAPGDQLLGAGAGGHPLGLDAGEGAGAALGRRRRCRAACRSPGWAGPRRGVGTVSG